MSVCNFANTVIQQSKQYPQKVAYKDGVEELTYGKLIDRIQQVANGLTAQGITTGTHVAISMEDCVDWPVVFLACIYQGIIPLHLSNSIGIDLFRKIVEFTDVKFVISGNDVSRLPTNITTITRSDLQTFYSTQSVVGSPVMLNADAPAYMSLSSGSTGSPKVAVYRHKTFFEILKLVPSISFGMNHDSTILSIAKMSWCFGLHNSITYTVGLGATAILIPEPPVAQTIFEYINKFYPTIVLSSPSIIRRLINSARSSYTLPNSIQHFNSSGEHLPAMMYDQFLKQYGIELSSCIGMMETCQTYAANPSSEHDRGTVGQPLPGCRVKLMNGDTEVIDNNVVGEIYVSSPASAIYYYNNYQKTKETFIGEWVKTNDLALRNNQGNLVFIGRADDVFKVNDLLVSPVEIESIILTNKTVQEVAVCKVKNDNELNTIHAFVIPGPDFDMTEFRTFISDRLFSHQIPKHIHLVDQLAETMTFKKDRRTLALSVEDAVC
jgi:benzoate-CoA ligase